MKPKVVLLIFVSGKIVLTGAKVREEIYMAFNQIYSVLVGESGFGSCAGRARMDPADDRIPKSLMSSLKAFFVFALARFGLEFCISGSCSRSSAQTA